MQQPYLEIFLGANQVVLKEKPSVTVLSIAGQGLVSVKQAENGLAVSATVISGDERVVATLTDNKFTVNPNNIFRLSRPDKSTLEVFDQFNHKALGVEYLNRKAMRIVGEFRVPGRKPVIVTQEEVKVLIGSGSSVFGGNCSVNAGLGFG